MDFLSGYASGKAIFDMLKGVNSLKNEAERNGAIIDIQRQVVDTLAGYSAALKRIDELEKQIVGFEKWDREAERYELTRFPMGAFAYVLKPSEANGEPAHRLCADCFQQGKKGFLQTTAAHSGGEQVQCSHCKSVTTLSEFQPSPPPRDYSPFGGY